MWPNCGLVTFTGEILNEKLPNEKLHFLWSVNLLIFYCARNQYREVCKIFYQITKDILRTKDKQRFMINPADKNTLEWKTAN